MVREAKGAKGEGEEDIGGQPTNYKASHGVRRKVKKK